LHEHWGEFTPVTDSDGSHGFRTPRSCGVLFRISRIVPAAGNW
jgi:hypothetical protein